VALACAFLLSACGVPLATTGPDDESEVRDLLEWSFTENDPAQCTEAITRRFLDEGWPGEGAEAMERCIEVNTESERPMASRITITATSITGETGSASVRIDEGQFVGYTMNLELVREGDAWKIDRYAGFDLDRATFDRQVRAGAIEDGFSKAEADCIVSRYRRMFTDSQLEELMRKEGEDAEASWVPAIALCMDGARIRSLFIGALRERLQDLPPAVVRCAVSVIRRQSIAQLRALTAAVPSGGGQSQMADMCRQFGAACAEKAQAAIAKQEARSAQAPDPKPAIDSPPSPAANGSAAPAHAANAGSSGSPTDDYLDCIAVAGNGREMTRCEEIIR
jgi:hypothetical protein